MLHGLRHRLLAAVGAGVVGLVTYWQLQPVAPPVPRQAAAAKPLDGVIPPTATLEAAMATLQRENASLRLTLAEQHVMRHQTHRLRAELDWLDTVLADLPAIVADETTREAD